VLSREPYRAERYRIGAWKAAFAEALGSLTEGSSTGREAVY